MPVSSWLRYGSLSFCAFDYGAIFTGCLPQWWIFTDARGRTHARTHTHSQTDIHKCVFVFREGSVGGVLWGKLIFLSVHLYVLWRS